MYTFHPCNDPDIFIMTITYACGSINEKDYQSGISHLLEHMMFKIKSKKNIFEMIERIGAIINAETSYDYTMYYIKCLKKDTLNAIDILLKYITGSLTLTEKEFEDEKKIVIEEFPIRNTIKKNRLYNNIFKNTLYNNKVIGTTESLSKITLHDIKEYHKHSYKHPIINISCCVPFYKQNKTKLDTLLGNEGTFCHNVTYLNFHQNINFTKYERNIIKQNYENANIVYMGFPASDFRSNTCFLISYILKKELFKELRTKQNIVYGIKVTYVPLMYIGYLYCQFNTKHSNCQHIIDVFNKMIIQLKYMKAAQFNKYLKEYELYKNGVLKKNDDLSYLKWMSKKQLYNYNEYTPTLNICIHVINTIFNANKNAFEIETKRTV